MSLTTPHPRHTSSRPPDWSPSAASSDSPPRPPPPTLFRCALTSIDNQQPTEKSLQAAEVGVEGRYALSRDPSSHGPAEDGEQEKGELTPIEAEEEEPWTYPEGGKGWWVVLGCWLYAGSTMGWGLVWGVFQNEYKANVFPEEPEAIITLINGVASFAMTATSFVAGRLGDRFGYKRMLLVANAIAFTAFLLSSFCTKLWQIFLVQGVFIGFGLGLSMPLYMALPSQWFLRKRGLATGIAVSGSGFFGAFNTLLVRLLIVRLGSRHTLLVFTFILSAFWFGAYFLLEERTPPPRKAEVGKDGKVKARPWLPKSCWKNPVFYSFMSSIFFSTFGFLTPYAFITTYTRSMVPSLASSSSIEVIVPLLIMNLCGAIGRILAGLAADSLGPVNMFSLSLLLAGLTQLLVWQFAHSYSTIIGFSILYGLFGAMFLSLLPVVAAQLFGVNDLATLVGFGVLVNSFGQLSGSTISGAIRDGMGGRWVGLIGFSGGMTVVGSLCMGWARFKGERRVWAAY